MLRIMLAAGFAVALAASPAWANCRDDIRDFDRKNDRIYPEANEAFQAARKAWDRGQEDRCRALIREARERQRLAESQARQPNDAGRHTGNRADDNAPGAGSTVPPPREPGVRERDRRSSDRRGDDDSVFGRIIEDLNRR